MDLQFRSMNFLSIYYNKGWDRGERWTKLEHKKSVWGGGATLIRRIYLFFSTIFSFVHPFESDSDTVIQILTNL